MDFGFWLGNTPSGWVWRLLHLAVLWLPLVAYYRYWQALIPGGGPQGGEAVLMCAVLHGIAFGVIGAMDGAIGAGLRGSGLGGAGLWFVGLGVAACCGCWLLIAAVAHAAAIDSTSGQRALGWAGAATLAPGLLAALFHVIGEPR